MDSLIIKRGDTLQLNVAYKEETVGTVINLSDFIITVSVIDTYGCTVIEVISDAPTQFRSISINDLVNGTFVITIKDTEVLIDDTYYIDFKYTTLDGIEQTSKAVKLIVKEKLV